VQRKIFGPKRDEVTDDWKRLHCGKLNDLYSSNITRVIKSLMGEGGRRGVCRVLVGRPDGKKRLGRRRLRWVVNIKLKLQEVEWECMDWIVVAQDRNWWRAFVNAVMNLLVP